MGFNLAFKVLIYECYPSELANRG